MKKYIYSLLYFLLLTTTTCWSQGFLNLNFDSSKVTNFVYYTLPVTVATVTGWTNTGVNTVTGDPSTVPFNSINLDAAGVSLEGTNNPYGPSSIQGKYSIFLQGGTQYASTTNGASIGQTAQISAASQSLTYWGGPLVVTFNSQLLAFNVIGSGSGYSIWQADVSPFAGQTGELLFTVPWKNSSVLDNIQFSTTAVPEPAGLSLLGLSGLGLWLLRNAKTGGFSLNRSFSDGFAAGFHRLTRSNEGFTPPNGRRARTFLGVTPANRGITQTFLGLTPASRRFTRAFHRLTLTGQGLTTTFRRVTASNHGFTSAFLPLTPSNGRFTTSFG